MAGNKKVRDILKLTSISHGHCVHVRPTYYAKAIGNETDYSLRSLEGVHCGQQDAPPGDFVGH